jgi:REP element-mobilizing transposase RayT
MKYDPQKHHRRSIRLRHHDYSASGAYFITMVTYHRDCLFGDIVNGEMQLSHLGQVAEEHWRLIPAHFPHMELGAYVVMTNHVHGIIVIHENRMATNSSPSVGARHASPLSPNGVKPGSIGAIVGSYKSSVTKRIGRECNVSGIWQRNYGACPECPSGCIEGNTLSAMRQNTTGFTSTSNPTSPTGARMMSIRKTHIAIQETQTIPHHSIVEATWIVCIPIPSRDWGRGEAASPPTHRLAGVIPKTQGS